MDATNIVLFIASFALILIGCEFFTNAVEWLGKKLNLAEGAVGSILAAIGTALPETLVPLDRHPFRRRGRGRGDRGRSDIGVAVHAGDLGPVRHWNGGVRCIGEDGKGARCRSTVD